MTFCSAFASFIVKLLAVITMKIDKKLVGDRIKRRGKAAGLTQEALAERIGLSKNHLSNIERGRYLPTIETMLLICDALGQTPDYYLIGKVSPETDCISQMIRCLPEDSQRIVCKLIETYLGERVAQEGSA